MTPLSGRKEEREGLTDLRRTAFAAFEAVHFSGVQPVQKDPKAYVAAHAP